jgi:hypothetical protein
LRGARPCTPGAVFYLSLWRKGGLVSWSAASNDNGYDAHHINGMRALLVLALFVLLALAIWFAASAFMHIGGDAIPLYGYVAIAGGVLFSLLVGGGLMALVFYSNRHGYDDDANRNDKTR